MKAANVGMMCSRLGDPKRVLDKELGDWLDALEMDEEFPREKLAEYRKVAKTISMHDLQNKIADMMTRLFKKPENGGNPFLFQYTSTKEHELCIKHGFQTIDTAATNGKKYFWNPIFLAMLTPEEASTVMQHEGYHVIFYHPKRGVGKMPEPWNWAIDYVANACIQNDHRKTSRKGNLFGGAIGTPLSLKDLLLWIDGKKEFQKGVTMCFADESLYGRSPESIYDEIIDHWNRSPRKCPKCGALSCGANGKLQGGSGGAEQSQGDQGSGQDQQGQGRGQDDQGQGQQKGCNHKCGHCGASKSPIGAMDSHIDLDVSKGEVQADLMRAAEQIRSMGRGTVPSEIEGVLGELQTPTLKFTDIVRNALLKKVQDAGMNNDWRRLRKRYLCTNPVQYLPRRYMHKPRWLAMLDTSGSMGDDDMAYGISQLQVLGNNTEGYIIPCDATPHWAGVHKVEKASDLKRTKVVGRGGTVFNEFFRDFPKYLGTEFDVIVVLTDGDCGDIPIELKPKGISVVWVLTRNNTSFKPSFGRVAPLKVERQ